MEKNIAEEDRYDHHHQEDNREFKKLRRQLQRKRHIKFELCVKFSLLRLFHVDHVIQNRRTALSLAWHEWFLCIGKEGYVYCCELALSSEPKIENFTSSFGRLRQNIAPKSNDVDVLNSLIGSLSNHDDDGNKNPTKFAYLTVKNSILICTLCTCVFHLLTF